MPIPPHAERRSTLFQAWVRDNNNTPTGDLDTMQSRPRTNTEQSQVFLVNGMAFYLTVIPLASSDSASAVRIEWLF